MTCFRVGFVLRFLLAWLCLEPRLSRAEESAPVVILVDPGTPTLARRLREEIEALGLVVRSVPGGDQDIPLEVLARSANAIAAVRIAPSGTGAVEMTIVDRTTGKTVSRRLAIDTPNDPAAAELIATRTVELLRASLMELAAEHPPRGEVRAAPVVEQLSTDEIRSTGRVSLAAGPSLAWSSGVESSFALSSALGVLLSEKLGITVGLVLPLGKAELETAEGRVDVFATQFRAGGMLELPLFGSPFGLRAETGLSLVRLALEGSANAPFVGERQDVFAVAPWFGLRLRCELTRNLGVIAGGDVGFAFPRVVIRSAGREVATWGRPLGSATLGAEFSWQ